MTPAEKFLNEIAKDLETQPGYNIREEVFFPLRYAKSRPLTVQHKEIAQELMPQDPRLGPGKYAAGIGTQEQNVRRAIVNKYKEEMTADGVDVNILLNGQEEQGGTEQEEQGGTEQEGQGGTEQGEQGGTKSKERKKGGGRKKGQGVIWSTVYDWLWNCKYPRWLEAHSWELLREKATSPANWIQFLTEEDKEKVVAGEKVLGGGFRGAYLDLPPAPEPEPEITPIIPANKRLLMQIDLEYPQYQLLLFNRSEAGTVLYCPSFGYAPQPIIEKPPVVLPQRDSWAGETKQNFLFKDKGQEEFLAIVLAKPLNLPWLAASKQEGIPKWNGQRILEVFNHLEQSGEWQVFYQSFEVVELKPADA